MIGEHVLYTNTILLSLSHIIHFIFYFLLLLYIFFDLLND